MTDIGLIKSFSAFAISDNRHYAKQMAVLAQKRVRYVRGFGGILN
jgi:hypothetical protein